MRKSSNILFAALLLFLAISFAFTTNSNSVQKIDGGWHYYDKERIHCNDQYNPLWIDSVNNGETHDPEGICAGMMCVCAIHFDEVTGATDSFVYYSIE